MPSINVSEQDFLVVAIAAHAAMNYSDPGQAAALDKIARKINAALTGAMPERKIATAASGRRSVVRWTDVPSVFDASDRPGGETGT